MDELIKQWDTILQRIRTEYEITDVSFQTWLKPLEVFSVEGNNLHLIYPREANQMSLSYIEKKYKTPLMVSIAEVTGVEYEINFHLPQDAMMLQPEVTTFSKEVIREESNLNAKYTFENFVVGSSNRFAQNAALAVAESPGKVYNPLYIYGGPGLGKTHLLHAIGNFIYKQNPQKRIIYVTSEQFVNEVIDSIRNNKSTTSMSRLREKYRKVDILMIDDIQFIIGKESTQEEFFHTFNALDSAGKQIIITSDRPPKELETLENRIKSRFEMGLMADIGYPDYETRMAIIRKKLENENVIISDDITNYIAQNIKSNVREIEGALVKLMAYSRMEKKEITMEVAEKELSNIISPDKPKEITPQLIIEIVADHYGITVDDMRSKNRSKTIAFPRQVAMYFCKNMTRYSWEAIGTFLGGKDHSTIIHGCKKIEQAYDNDPEIKQQIDTISKKINPG